MKPLDVSDMSQDEALLSRVLDAMVEEVGEENVVQIVTENASAYKLACQMLERKRKQLFWTPCAAHCIHLMDRVMEGSGEEERQRITSELTKYQNAKGTFGRNLAIKQSTKLLKLGRFQRLHTKKRNQLAQEKLNNTMYVKYKRASQRRHRKEGATHLIELEDIDGSNEWLMGKMEDDQQNDDDDDLLFIRVIPDLRKMLISIGKLEDEGFDVDFGGGQRKFVKGDVNAVTGGPSLSSVWHQQLGHMSKKCLKILAGKGKFLDLKKVELDDTFCEPCVLGKKKHVTFVKTG
ncbi:hypothetical protein E3N88_15582 [Mikania micrantha]|uniref:GAG-pre-integrase domain-containing protein n=1 Tax=Mikania micrantha TaxID=192012 RepID=A0A5N6NWE5_9ASTR|nr:hypothetical protein E3N88_15582 [Mikania micrantha]